MELGNTLIIHPFLTGSPGIGDLAREFPYRLAVVFLQATCLVLPVACEAPRETARRVNPGCHPALGGGAGIETYQRLLEVILDLITQDMWPLGVVCGNLCGDRNQDEDGVTVYLAITHQERWSGHLLAEEAPRLV